MSIFFNVHVHALLKDHFYVDFYAMTSQLDASHVSSMAQKRNLKCHSGDRGLKTAELGELSGQCYC